MRAAIALGANLPSRFGAPADTLREAVRQLGSLGRVLAVSPLLETEPVGFLNQPRFHNGAVLLQTELDPLTLLHALLALETAFGRRRDASTPPKGPRTLDLDLLLYEDNAGRGVILNTPALTLPHPEMHRRPFVLQPLAAIAPTLQHPLLHRTIHGLWMRVDASQAVPSCTPAGAA